MARLARITAPDVPYHVTQRGNRRQRVFFGAADYQHYLQLLHAQSTRWGLEVWAYCLMPNHVHLLVVPTREESLTRTIGDTHRAYTRTIHFREGWRGYLWQGRFASYPLDEAHLLAAVRYIERNPVAARLVARAEDYPWSSARAHVAGQPDPVLSPCFLTEQITDWREFLAGEGESSPQLEQHLRTGRPLGARAFVADLEQRLGRSLQRQKPGPKPKVLVH